MNFGRISSCLVWALILLYTTVDAQSPSDYKRLYDYAEKLSIAANHTDKTDEIAVQAYLKTIRALTATNENNPFLFQVYVNTGAFLQALGRQNESISYFKKAIALKTRLPVIKDSVLFRPLVYCGNAYYTIDKPDTAESLYRKAESIADKYPDINEVERLYNTLGVVSYSKGNYSESVIYYEKAVSTLLKHPRYEKSLLVAYKNNLATAFNKLKKYDQALQIYHSLLPYKSETDKLFHNIGSTYLAMGETGPAINFLKKVSYKDQWNLNDLGLAYLKEGNYNEAIECLQKSADLNTRVNKARKNSDYGITLKYFGDVWFEKKQYLKAISFYQQSIINLLPDFNSNE